ncbi:invasion associated locus B family protein [Cognatishimia sp. SS12]|uniref:invasion associated locus B family protein n=1 Tax=Cognatishimia sp. SS12 TaxID=2979465 RepID=UPI00232F3B66|nr:invasion associated locus B family protein [Cognatishimia sp. SS12]MDC0737246.1 invasion associated locus B family protein [Cognatishimia sp. SS12]
MLKNINKILLTSVFLMGSAAVAQEAGTAEDTPAEAPAATSGAEGLSTGQDLAQQAPEIKNEEIGDWVLRCQALEGGERCQMYQLLRDATDNPVVEVNFFPVDNGGQVAAGGSIVVPLETLLTAQLTVTVDDGAAKRYPFAFCTPNGCVARIGLTAEDIASYKKGAKATVSLVPVTAPDKTVSVDMSLSGFTATYDKMNGQ